MCIRDSVVTASWAAVAAPALVLDDPLTQPKASAQTVTGGSFGAGGWTRDGFDSQIIYDLGASITAGRLTFEMNGVNGKDHGLGGFPDCRAIFAALDNNGSGNIDDPGNESVQFLWAWAMEETNYCNGGPGGFERTDKMKLLVHTGGSDEPGEPMSDPLLWDVTKFYAYEIGWDTKHAWLLRDGATVLDQIFPAAPNVMNLRYVFLGTVKRYKSGVKNATYRNLKLWDDGGPIPTDGGSPIDAGGDASMGCLSAGSFSPTNSAGTSATFSLTYSNCEGASAFRIVQLWVGDEVKGGSPAVSASYEAGQLRLDGSVESCAPGASQVLTSAYGSLECATSSVSLQGNDLVVSWSLRFDPSKFSGTHPVFVDAKGGSGTPEPRLGWTAMGTFAVESSVDGGKLDGGAGASGGTTPAEGSDCGCRLPGGGGRHTGAIALLGLLSVGALARRRKRACES